VIVIFNFIDGWCRLRAAFHGSLFAGDPHSSSAGPPADVPLFMGTVLETISRQVATRSAWCGTGEIWRRRCAGTAPPRRRPLAAAGASPDQRRFVPSPAPLAGCFCARYADRLHPSPQHRQLPEQWVLISEGMHTV
jgi:hypothetical protein